MKGPATGRSSASLLKVFLPKGQTLCEDSLEVCAQGDTWDFINRCIRSPSGEKFGLLYGVPLSSESMWVLGYIYGGVSFAEGAKEDL